MPIDAVLIIIAIAAYAASSLAFVMYLFSGNELVRRAAAALALGGCVAQSAQLIARYEITHIWPLLNLYGSLSLFSALSVAIYLTFAVRYRIWAAGALVMPLAALFLAYAVSWNEGSMPAVPSLQSYWAKIHVPIIIGAYAAFLVSFACSCLYLLKYYLAKSILRRAGLHPTGSAQTIALPINDRSSSLYISRSEAFRQGAAVPTLETTAESGEATALWLNTLPSLPQLDILVYRIIAVGLPLLTLGLITGAMWAREAWGAYWQWDPKETSALFAWIVYAIYMHLHTRSAWRGLRSAWISVMGFAAIIFCYLGVNIWISGMHSYKL